MTATYCISPISTGKYLETPSGAPTRQILTIARKGLRLDLRSIFREAAESGLPVTREGMYVENESGGVQMVTIAVERLAGGDGGEPLFLILFMDQGPIVSREDANDRINASRDGSVEQIERELRETRERLQSVIEEYETALEELKSSNEELVSVNEELQSTNEELEASKEELQSVNEELHTVNVELTSKVDALDRANGDLRNLFESTEVAIAFLDACLAIRSYTLAMSAVFNVLPTDVGRPITDLSSHLDMSGLAVDIREVLATGISIERPLEDHKRVSKYLVRIAPYRNLDRRIDGVVVTFVDVTSLARAESRQRVLIAELQHRTRNLLSIVQSIAQQTLGNGGSLDSFTERLGALGRVQRLVGGAMDDHIDLADIVKMELGALGSHVRGKVKVDGPQVMLGFEPVQTFGLAIHELATNAVKHGALKGDAGQLSISWSVRPAGDDGALLMLEWKETDVADMPKPTRTGFGRELIERALAFTLRASTKMMFEKDGVVCTIEMPIPRQPPRQAPSAAA